MDFSALSTMDFGPVLQQHALSSSHVQNGSGQLSMPGKLFVGGLSHQTTEASMAMYFSQFGDILSAQVMRDPSSGRSRGFGFVCFRSLHSAVDAASYATHLIDGWTVEAKHAVPRSNASHSRHPRQHGVPANFGGRVRAAGSLTEEAHQQALHSFNVKPGGNFARRFPAQAAATPESPDNEGIIRNKIFVGGLTYGTDEKLLREYFSHYGPVDSTEVIVNRDTRKSRCFGFVVFFNRELMNRHHVLDGKQIEVKACQARSDHSAGAVGGRSAYGPTVGRDQHADPVWQRDNILLGNDLQPANVPNEWQPTVGLQSARHTGLIGSRTMGGSADAGDRRLQGDHGTRVDGVVWDGISNESTNGLSLLPSSGRRPEADRTQSSRLPVSDEPSSPAGDLRLSETHGAELGRADRPVWDGIPNDSSGGTLLPASADPMGAPAQFHLSNSAQPGRADLFVDSQQEVQSSDELDFGSLLTDHKKSRSDSSASSSSGTSIASAKSASPQMVHRAAECRVRSTAEIIKALPDKLQQQYTATLGSSAELRTNIYDVQRQQEVLKVKLSELQQRLEDCHRKEAELVKLALTTPSASTQSQGAPLSIVG